MDFSNTRFYAKTDVPTFRKVCRKYPNLRKLMKGDRLVGMDLLTMFILICIGITHPQTPVVWNLARTRKDAYVISDYLTSMFNLTCKEYTPNDFVHPLGHGLLLFKDIYNFPASFFHADNVFIHVACAAKPSLSVCSDSVAPHTTALYIYKEEIS